jgi:hypothetical protein
MRTRVARRVVAGAIAVALGAMAPEARGDDAAPVRLQWIAPAGCPTNAEVVASVERILGGSAGGTRQAVTARAVVSKLGSSRWRVRLTTQVGASTGERTVDADSCRAVADAAALILALAVNPESAAPPPAPIPAPVPAPVPVPVPAGPVPLRPQPQPGTSPPTAPASPIGPSVAPTASRPPEPVGPSPTSPPGPPSSSPPGANPPPTAPPPSPAPAQTAPTEPTATSPPPSTSTAAPAAPAVPKKPRPASTSQPARTPHHIAVALMGTGVVGSLPSLGAGGEAVVAYRPWRLRFEAGAAYFVPQSTPVPEESSQTGDFSLISIIGRAGYTLTIGHLEIVPGLLVEGEVMKSEATGTHLTPSSPQWSPWLDLGAGGWVFWAFTREFALRLGVEAAFPLSRPSFEVTGSRGAVYQPAPIVAKGAIGLELRFL